MFKQQKGFTLIELLVVIAILGILAAVVVPAVTSFIGSGEEEGAETELANVQLAVAALMADPDPPVRTFDGSDTRIAAYQDCGGVTRNMLDGGLITLGGSPGEVNPEGVAGYLQADTTQFWYCVEDDGTVHGYYESDQTTEILPNA